MARSRLFSRIIVSLVNKMMPLILHRMNLAAPWKENFFYPSPHAIGFSSDHPFMDSSVCVPSDFYHTEFKRLCDFIGADVHVYRKLWEFAFIVHHAERSGMLGPGRRGLAFGVGKEPLPAAFASLGCEIMATDAPLQLAIDNGWVESSQFAPGLSGLTRGRLDDETFDRLIRWRECDMRAIDPALTDYDFCWSACCLEHLGDLQSGLDFILETVEKTLKVGGWAFHTTEFNLSSNAATLDKGATVIYRRRDLEGLIAKLRERGHEVADLHISPNAFVMNDFVDTPPYRQHLLLSLDGFTATSVGLAIRRGR